jgi:hypothetical protein
MPPVFSGRRRANQSLQRRFDQIGRADANETLHGIFAGSAAGQPPQTLPAHGHTGFLNVDAAGMDHDLAGALNQRVFHAKSPASTH